MDAATVKILLFGPEGYLGKAIAEYFRHDDGGDPLFELVPTGQDITDEEAVRAAIADARPDVVINAAGRTGRPNIDSCETDKQRTMRDNVLGPLLLLDACDAFRIRLVHLGSGCIFENATHHGVGSTFAFSEDDPPNFDGSFYSKTKKIADEAMRARPDRVLNLRIWMPFDGTLSPRNLITKLAGYQRVLDMPNSMTYVPDLLASLRALLERGRTGTYHVVNQGWITPFEIMERYRAIVDPDHRFVRLDLRDLPEVAKAPRSNCVLSMAKLAAEGVDLPAIHFRVDEALTQMAALRSTDPDLSDQLAPTGLPSTAAT